jgi:hypothetical protein
VDILTFVTSLAQLNLIRNARRYIKSNVFDASYIPVVEFTYTREQYDAWRAGTHNPIGLGEQLKNALEDVFGKFHEDLNKKDEIPKSLLGRFKHNIENHAKGNIKLPESRKHEMDTLQNQGPFLGLQSDYFPFNKQFFRHGDNVFKYKWNSDFEEVHDHCLTVRIDPIMKEFEDLRSLFAQSNSLKATNLHFSLVEEIRHVPRDIAILSLYDIIKRIYWKNSLFNVFEDNGVDRWEKYDVSEYTTLLNKTQGMRLVMDFFKNMKFHINMILQLYMYQDCNSYYRQRLTYVICDELSQRCLVGVPVMEINKSDNYFTTRATSLVNNCNLNDGYSDVYKILVMKAAIANNTTVGDPNRTPNIVRDTGLFSSAKWVSALENHPPHVFSSSSINRNG